MTRTAANLYRRQRYGMLGHIAVMLLALAVIWGSILVNMESQRQAVQEDAAKDADNLVRAFTENISRVVGGLDQTLQRARDQYERDPAHFDLAAWSRTHPRVHGDDVMLLLVDKAGNVAQTSEGPPAQSVNLAERDAFKAMAKNPADQLMVGAPLTGVLSNRPMIVLWRPLAAGGGSFEGALAALLDPAELSRFYASMAIGNGSITLADQQGDVLARVPDGPHTVGRTLDSTFMRLMRREAPAGHFEAESALDHTKRLYSFRRLEQPGLLLTVGLAQDDVFATYRFNRSVSVAGGGIVSLGVIGVTLLMIRQRRRLLRSNEVLAVTLENMNQGIQMVEPDGRVGVINSRAIELLGLPPALLEGQPLFRDVVAWQVESGEFGDPDKYPDGLRQTLAAGGIASTPDTYERCRPNGTVLEIATNPMPDGGAVRTYTDITERKRVEAELAAARDAAEASGRARMEFLAMMSHEIRTPMNSIIGFASLLMDMPLGSTVHQYVRIIRQSGNHLLQLINDILDLSKLDAGKLQLENEAFDLREEIGQTIELLIGQAQEKHLTLSAEVAPQVPRRIFGDPGRLRQILINLIGNGLKFSSVGGVAVHVGLFKDDGGANRLSFRVTDTGIGIPSEKVSLLFRHFSQLGESGSRQYGGTGLGLAICKRLVEQMGGGIGVQSEPGRGSMFYFDLPLVVADAAPVLTPQPGSLRVLLADDNDTNRMVIARLLERLGHRVDMVVNGLEAVEAIRTRPYDLTVMDVAMPEMDGLAAAEAIRDLTGRRGRVPIIGLTASVAGEIEDACYRAGMNAFMTKPVTLEKLDRAIALAMAPVSAPAAPGG
ncbi:ATP-binding protein [Rhodopila sp.]|jgi:signal transduction histidine kinase/ActR/RegA family two-component response regulator|uniref:ATP-binding protein n=1 Tax=Rhodopila sp. TaxID=2480087 RepID=UPI002BB18A33|nr:ATP-binding protein [Rhodopila sp.]HVZ08344.1 ATP-binding protein [Rhodopila sp.]